MSATQKIGSPAAGERNVVYAQPGEKLNFAFNLKDAKVDILGSDMILTLPNGGQVVLNNMGVMLFGDNPPQLLAGNTLVNPNDLLSKIGLVQSVSGKDVAALTSMKVTENTKTAEKVVQKVVKEVKIVEQPKSVVTPKEQTVTSVAAKQPLTQFNKQADLILKKFSGEFSTPPSKSDAPIVSFNPPKVDALFNPATGDGDGSITFTTNIKALQTIATSSISAGNILTVQGGGGSSAAAIDNNPLTQIQAEFIDTSRNNREAIIYADNSQFISETLLSKVLLYTPDVPLGYSLSEVVISGLPAGFTLKGLTPNGDGDYVLGINELSGGNQKFILQYDPTQFGGKSDLDGDGLVNELQDFAVTVASTAQQDGTFAATETSLFDTLVIPVVVKDTSSTDFSYAGESTGWVLDVKPNENIILTGDGNVTVYGGLAADRVTTGAGNDIVFVGTGDDVIRMNNGNDTVDTGTGNNTVDGGNGSDTVTYSSRTEAVSIDLTSPPDADGFYTVTVGSSQQDEVRAVENITGGSGNDSLIGDAEANTFIGGVGDDLLIGYGGNDTLTGGLGSDTISYVYAAAFSSTGVTVDLNTTTVTVSSTDVDTISGIENVIGTQYADTLLGSSSANTLEAGDGNDFLNGRTGNDTLDGGLGVDTVSFSDQTAGVTLTLLDTGNATASVGNGDSSIVRNVENLVGSAFDDVFAGNTANNTFTSSAGNDSYVGGGGSDTLTYSTQTSGLNADLLNGSVVKSLGTDTFSAITAFVASDQDDIITGGGSVATIDGGAGSDTLRYDSTSGSLAVNLAAQTVTDAVTQSFTNIENAAGGSGSDTLTGNSSANVLQGLGGDDIFIASLGGDTLDGGSGTDRADYTSALSAVTIDLGAGTATNGSGGTDTLISIEHAVGSSFDDFIAGSSGNDIIDGGGGNDTIYATEGNDTIDGGIGSNNISYVNLATSIVNIDYSTVGALGYTTITFANGKFDLVRNVDVYQGTSGNDTVTGGAGSGGGGLGSSTGGGGGGGGGPLMGVITVDGGEGSDTITFASETNPVTVNLTTDTATGSFGTYSIPNFENATGGSADDIITGDAGNNTLQGGGGNDIIYGTIGNDTLNGGTGTNTLDYGSITVGLTISPTTVTGAGVGTQAVTNFAVINATAQNDTINDDASSVTYNTGAGNDTINANAGNDVFDGGGDIDTLSYANYTNSGLVVNMSNLDSNGFFDIVIGAETDKAKNIEILVGGNNNDTLTGDSNANTIIGDAGNDTITGGAGNDTLDGGIGVDTLNYSTAGSGVVLNLGTLVSGYATATIGGETDLVRNFETLIGSNLNDTLTGDSSANTITGGNGNDTLDGGAGLDVIDGGIGTDTATYISLTSGVTVSGMTVTDSNGNVEALTNIEIVAGTNLGDTFTGTASADTYFGLDGNDTFIGTLGNDVLEGGNGTDTINYSSIAENLNINLRTGVVTGSLLGMQTLTNIENVVGTSNNDTIEGSAGANNLNGGAGTDTLSYANATAGVTANLTSGTATDDSGATDTISNFENLTGSGFNDTLTGSAGNNTISAGVGNDTLLTSLGNDTIDGGTGTDSFSYASVSTAITVDLSSVNGSGYSTITVAGGKADLIRNVETLVGSSGNDSITGSTTADTLLGSGGNDTLIGLGGNDILDGGTGTDTADYTYSANAVTVNLGTLVGGYAQLTFASSAEVDSLTGIENITGTGQGDTLTGDGNANVLLGAGGNDTFFGDAGNDTLDGGTGTDTLDFSANATAVSVTLNSQSATAQSIISGYGTDSIRYIENITTGDGNDVITTTSDVGDNTIILGGGIDAVYGGGGNDTFDGGTGTDTLRYDSFVTAVTIDLSSVNGSGYSTVTKTGGTDLVRNFEIVYGGTVGDTLSGSSGVDTFFGGAGNDTLNGNDGNDILYGDNGSDTLNGGNNDDILYDTNSTFASNNTNILNGGAGNDTLYLTVATNTIDGGTGTDTLSYNDGSGTSNNLTFNVLAGTVTDGTNTDSFSSIEIYNGSNGNDLFIGSAGADTFYGNNGNDTFRGGAQNDSFFGGAGTDTADYSTAASGVTASLTTNTASNDGDGGVDAFNSIENITGSAFNDTLTGDSGNNTLSGGAGNDTFIGDLGNDTLNGGLNTDTINYTASANAIAFDLTSNTAIGTSIGTDTYLGIENINTGAGNDSISSDAGNFFANTINFNLGSGTNDRVVLSGGAVGTDATTFATRIDNVEYLDFRNANTGGGNLIIDGDDIVTMTDSNASLRLDIGVGFGLTVQAGSYAVSSSTTGSQTTYTFTSGGNFAAKLDVFVA